jgi:uncharacterized membrane protein YqgA involved in biofilm formation
MIIKIALAIVLFALIFRFWLQIVVLGLWTLAFWIALSSLGIAIDVVIKYPELSALAMLAVGAMIGVSCGLRWVSKNLSARTSKENASGKQLA